MAKLEVTASGKVLKKLTEISLEELIPIVASSKSANEVARKVSQSKTQFKTKYDRDVFLGVLHSKNIDTTHFKKVRNQYSNAPTEVRGAISDIETMEVGKLNDIVKQCLTYKDFFHKFYSFKDHNDYTSKGSRCINEIRDILNNKGISTDHFKKKNEISNEEIFIENSPYPRSDLRIRVLRDNLKEYVCVWCGLHDFYNGKKLTLQLDHINGIPDDNRLDNLRWLCPNCHSQTDTYMGKNAAGKRIVSKSLLYALTKEETIVLYEKHNACIRSLSKELSIMPKTLRRHLRRLGIISDSRTSNPSRAEKLLEKEKLRWMMEN